MAVDHHAIGVPAARDIIQAFDTPAHLKIDLWGSQFSRLVENKSFADFVQMWNSEENLKLCLESSGSSHLMCSTLAYCPSRVDKSNQWPANGPSRHRWATPQVGK